MWRRDVQSLSGKPPGRTSAPGAPSVSGAAEGATQNIGPRWHVWAGARLEAPSPMGLARVVALTLVSLAFGCFRNVSSGKTCWAPDAYAYGACPLG